MAPSGSSSSASGMRQGGDAEAGAELGGGDSQEEDGVGEQVSITDNAEEEEGRRPRIGKAADGRPIRRWMSTCGRMCHTAVGVLTV